MWAVCVRCYNRGAAKYPDKRSIISEIWRRKLEGLPLNYSAIRQEDDALRRRTTALFGGWKYAVIEAGLSYDDVRVDTDMASYYGYVFEAVVGDILAELRVPYERYAHSQYNPDFVLSNGVWVGVKLSEWTARSRDCDTIEKYRPHCRALRIVYLRGRDLDTMFDEKTRFTHVNSFVRQLPKSSREKYIANLSEIQNALTEVAA